VVTLAATVDLRQRFGLHNSKPKTEMTMTDERMALLELVEQQADGDLVRGWRRRAISTPSGCPPTTFCGRRSLTG